MSQYGLIGMRVWISDIFLGDVITNPCQTSPAQFNFNAIEFSVWISNYIIQFYMDVITYPCPNPDTALEKSVSERGPRQWFCYSLYFW